MTIGSVFTDRKTIYATASAALGGVISLILGWLIGNAFLQGFGGSIVGGLLVGLGFQVATARELAALKKEANQLARWLRIARQAGEEGIIGFFRSRNDPELEEEIRKQIEKSSELWIAGTTAHDFFDPKMQFHSVTNAFAKRAGTTLHVIQLDSGSEEFKRRKLINQPNLGAARRYELDRHHEAATDGIANLKKHPGCENRIASCTTSQIPCWILATREVMFVQCYHYGYPPEFQDPEDDTMPVKSGPDYYSVAHAFPVLEFQTGSRAYRTLLSHLHRVEKDAGGSMNQTPTG